MRPARCSQLSGRSGKLAAVMQRSQTRLSERIRPHCYARGTPAIRYIITPACRWCAPAACVTNSSPANVTGACAHYTARNLRPPDRLFSGQEGTVTQSRPGRCQLGIRPAAHSAPAGSGAARSGSAPRVPLLVGARRPPRTGPGTAAAAWGNAKGRVKPACGDGGACTLPTRQGHSHKRIGHSTAPCMHHQPEQRQLSAHLEAQEAAQLPLHICPPLVCLQRVAVDTQRLQATGCCGRKRDGGCQLAVAARQVQAAETGAPTSRPCGKTAIACSEQAALRCYRSSQRCTNTRRKLPLQPLSKQSIQLANSSPHLHRLDR